MTKIMVKCPYCGEYFDRNNPDIKFIKLKNRYAHVVCYEKYQNSLTQEQRDLIILNDYIKKLLGDDYVYIKVKKQIAEFHKEYNYSYSGMLKALKWYYEVHNANTDKANGGIGIIPYIYNDAYKYYYNLYIAQQKNKSVSGLKDNEAKEIIITSLDSFSRPPQLIDLEDLD